MAVKEKDLEALGRARTGQSLANYAKIINSFVERGIPEDEIVPRENVFTFAAWRALGRFVRKGEHGVKVLAFERGQVKEDVTDPVTGEADVKIHNYSRPRMVSVFHISQTELAG